MPTADSGFLNRIRSFSISPETYQVVTLIALVVLVIIVFTGAADSTRQFLKDLNQRVRTDLYSAFPTLVQDQTPKYTKMMRAFEQRSPIFSAMLWLSVHPRASWLCGVGVALLVMLAIAARRPDRHAPLGRTAGLAPEQRLALHSHLSH